ncbi:hypothetical protein AB1Y20_001860 [Prymnesium parvum]|uniref:SET domain-containing protein n=1 Tax=Prymnesium parvum TaxID=97485 RepID=A0AB34J8Y6_PRYPA
MPFRKPKHAAKREGRCLVPCGAAVACACVAALMAWLSRRGEARLSADAERAARGMELLAALLAAGAEAAALEVRPSARGGVGLFTTRAAARGELLLSLPSRLMINASRAHLWLLAEAGAPSSALAQLYLRSLPHLCPQNLPARAAADAAAAAASLHAPLVRRLAAEAAELPSGARGVWAQCTALSRAFEGQRLEPLLDLANYAPVPSCEQAYRADAHQLLAAAPLRAGEELTIEYVQPSSRALLLLTFGIDATLAPAAAFGARLPAARPAEGCERAPPWLALHLLPSAALDVPRLAGALRCVRLGLYSAAEAQLALASDHLAPPLGRTRAPAPVLRKDRQLYATLRQGCASAIPAHLLAQQPRLFAAASAEVAAALRDEASALQQCARLMRAATRAIDAALEALGEGTPLREG